MCGRIVQAFEEADLREIVDLKNIFTKLSPRYNIAPSQNVPIIRLDKSGTPQLVELKWGFIPHWATPERNFKPQINARSEGIESKPFFRNAIKSNRCLIPISAFYEWKKDADRKQPYFISTGKEKPFLLAGLWDSNSSEQNQTFAIITTEPNDVMKTIHNRMPVVIANEQVTDWLKAPTQLATSLLQPWAGQMETYKVSMIVNSPTNDSPECIKKID